MGFSRFKLTSTEIVPRCGRPVTEILVKSLMVPPGVEDFVTRDGVLESRYNQSRGPSLVRRRKNISKVEFGINGKMGKSKILDKVGKYAWTKWVFDWDAKPGQYILQCQEQVNSIASSPKNRRGIWEVWNNSPHSIKVFVKISGLKIPDIFEKPSLRKLSKKISLQSLNTDRPTMVS